MSKLDDNMKDVFNLPDEEVEVVQSEVVPEEKKTRDEDVTKDYEYTRGQLYNLIEKGQEGS